MILQILTMFGLTVLQNASFTLVSRARNSKSLSFHTMASILSNGIYLLVIRHVVTNLDNWVLMVTYVFGAVVGGLIMHHISMNYLEKITSWKDLFKSKPMYYNGKRIKGFAFTDEESNGLGFYGEMKQYIGQVGVIEGYEEDQKFICIRFEDGNYWYYPKKQLKNK